MSGKSQTTVASGSSATDGLSCSEIKKKIKRSFFKEDVAVKSYKCDVLGHDIDTSAKLYISNRAFYVVHRPKRKKLTTMLFTEISNIKARNDQQGVEVFRIGDGAYTFTGFQRPESAIAFILNFWNMIRKEKIVLRHCQINSRTDLPNCTAASAQLQDGTNSTTPESLRIPHMPTTISLNSSASISETDSMDSRHCSESKSLTDRLPIASLESSKSQRSTANRSANLSVSSACAELGQRDPQTIEPTVSPKTTHTGAISPENRSALVNADHLTTDNQSDRGEHRQHHRDHGIPPLVDSQGPSPDSTRMRHSTSAPTTHNLHGISRPGCTLKPRTNHPFLSETPGWSLWPLSFLPYPFSSPPQRLTMIIAYAILGFLLFSTMHLYHRLAMFDLQGSPFVRTTRFTSAPSTGSNTVRFSLHSLERQLSELVELTGQLAQSLMHMTGEMRSMRLDAESSATPATSSSSSPSSTPPPPPQPAPPV